MLLLLLLSAGLVVFLKDKQKEQMIRSAYILTGLLLMLMPAALHAWYVILIIPFLAFYPAVGWLVFTCTVSLSYLKYVSPGGNMPSWVLAAEFVPLFALLSGGYLLQRYGPSGWSTARQGRPTAGTAK